MSRSAIGETNIAWKVRTCVVGRLLCGGCFDYLGSFGHRLGRLLLEPVVALLGVYVSGDGVRFGKASI